jgi:hypothetical protein
MERMNCEVQAMVMRLEPALASRLPQLTALHLLRTLPYTSDEKLTAFILTRAAALLESST